MDGTRIRASSEIAAADWIAERIDSYQAWTIGSIVPTGFEAYARIFHPAVGPEEKRVSWSDVAAWSGKVMHPHAEFDLLERRVVGEGAGRTHGYEPSVGELEPDLVATLAELLAAHTQSAERCWFCIWEGGWITGPGGIGVRVGTPQAQRDEIQRQYQAAWRLPFGREALAGPRVRLPCRDYVLLKGSLDAIVEIGESMDWQGQSFFGRHSPNLWWPDDQAWCVASEIDLPSTHVGGSAALIDEILGDSRFEALLVSASDVRGDNINKSS